MEKTLLLIAVLALSLGVVGQSLKIRELHNRLATAVAAAEMAQTHSKEAMAKYHIGLELAAESMRERDEVQVKLNRLLAMKTSTWSTNVLELGQTNHPEWHYNSNHAQRSYRAFQRTLSPPFP